jgi:hypothetical protein
LDVRSPEPEQAPWKSLVIHSGRGGGLKNIRESLKSAAGELRDSLTAA